MNRPIDEAMAEARQFFLERAAEATGPGERVANAHLRELAEAIQEVDRMVEVLRRQIDELHHVVGVR